MEEALRIFEGLGAIVWAGKARAELRRVGLRPPAPSALTPTGEQVAALPGGGRTNREIADALFMSPKSVEANLSRIYRKREVRSRAALASRLAEVDASGKPSPPPVAQK